MTARTLMRSSLVKLRTTDTVVAAAQVLLQHHLRHLPVVDEQGRYVGTFGIYSVLQLTLPTAVLMREGLDNVAFITETAHDLAQRLRERGQELVSQWLSRDPVVYPDTPTMKIVQMMLHGHTSVPVVDRDSHRLEGMISSSDVLRTLLEEKQ
jgi:acetoin utilization protein AcuB